MKTRICFAIALCLLMLSSSVYAQSGPGFFANFDVFVPKKTPSGTSTEIGSIYHLNQDAVRTRLGSNLSSEIDSEPLIVDFPQKFILKGSGGLVMRNGFGARIGFFTYENSGEIGGLVTSSPQSTLSHNVSGVRQWGVQVPVALDPLQPSGFSPVSYAASTALNIHQIDARLVRNFCFESCSLSISGGISYAEIKSGRREGQAQRAFIPDRRTLKGIIDDISLESESESVFKGWGPVIGADLSFDMGGAAAFHVRGSQAFLMSDKLQESGVWSSHERGVLGTMLPTGLSRGLELFTTRTAIPMNPGQVKTVVPVTDVQVGLRLKVAGDCLEIGPALSWTRFSDMPVAPSWTIPMSAPLTASSWNSNKTNLDVFSVAVSVGVRF